MHTQSLHTIHSYTILYTEIHCSMANFLLFLFKCYTFIWLSVTTHYTTSKICTRSPTDYTSLFRSVMLMLSFEMVILFLSLSLLRSVALSLSIYVSLCLTHTQAITYSCTQYNIKYCIEWNVYRKSLVCNFFYWYMFCITNLLLYSMCLVEIDR